MKIKNQQFADYLMANSLLTIINKINNDLHCFIAHEAMFHEMKLCLMTELIQRDLSFFSLM